MSAGHAEWTALAGATIAATDDTGAERPLVLTTVTPARHAGGWVAYTLTFRGDADFPAVQQTYRLSGDDIDEPVFLVPSGRDADGILLEAVFAQAPGPDNEED